MKLTEAPKRPNPPEMRAHCACGKVVPLSVWRNQHQRCKERVRARALLTTWLLIAVVFGIALAINPSMPWNNQ